MPLRHYNPHTGRRLVTLNLTSAPKRCAWLEAVRTYWPGEDKNCLHVIALNRECVIGSTHGIVRAYGFVGRVFQVTLEQVPSSQ